jgi:membrane protease YdiL (CAAX protease family)
VYGLAPLMTLVRQPSLIIGYLVQTVVVAALVNLWEETGWTGFMFTRLQPRYGALMASLLVAPCFGGIHLPLLFVTDGLTSGRLAPPQIPLYTLYLLVVFSVPVRVVASWLYNNARGSLLHVGLLHASLGAVAGSVLLPYLVPHGADPTFVVYGAIAVLALVVGLVTRGRLSYKASLELQPAPSAM